ncbi:phosphatase PAP2 family protein [Dyadobacter frigoris]|uniref:Phosphatase PAP2 family protein n=1 Tax=Dyadobacter frigoris TaxID=2576211 RepID=A0A4U6D3Q9_9BACT|nr:phosphatase PAP2 family protein [Dyadobacter frigoris]TKT90548.1 phosphatase PAP2 family protein [Dyadobacter frigoris]GLU51312.1 phosphatase PAP2 family protein [Dyadobacter frigoris]
MKKVFLFYCIFCFSTAQAQTAVDNFDLAMMQKLEASRSDGQTKFMRGISDANNYVNAGIPAGLFVAGIIDHNRSMRQNAFYVFSSTACTAILNHTLKKIFKRPRPFILHISLTPVYKPGEYSLPSGHTSTSFSTATALSMAYPKWYVIAPSMLWAGTVGYSRMYLGVHNPSDVAAGAGLGLGTALGLSFMRR